MTPEEQLLDELLDESKPGSINQTIKVFPDASRIDETKTSGRKHRALLASIITRMKAWVVVLLAGKSDTGHGHTIGEVDNLQTTLNSHNQRITANTEALPLKADLVDNKVPLHQLPEMSNKYELVRTTGLNAFFSTLQAAVDAAASNETVYMNTNSAETITLSRPITIDTRGHDLRELKDVRELSGNIRVVGGGRVGKVIIIGRGVSFYTDCTVDGRLISTNTAIGNGIYVACAYSEFRADIILALQDSSVGIGGNGEHHFYGRRRVFYDPARPNPSVVRIAGFYVTNNNALLGAEGVNWTGKLYIHGGIDLRYPGTVSVSADSEAVNMGYNQSPAAQGEIHVRGEVLMPLTAGGRTYGLYQHFSNALTRWHLYNVSIVADRTIYAAGTGKVFNVYGSFRHAGGSISAGVSLVAATPEQPLSPPEGITSVAGAPSPVTGVWSGTQAEYDAIAVKDGATLYFVKDDPAG